MATYSSTTRRNEYSLVIVCLGQTKKRRKMFVITDGIRRLEFSLSPEDEYGFNNGVQTLEILSRKLGFPLSICCPNYPSQVGTIKEKEIKERLVDLDTLAQEINRIFQLKIPGIKKRNPRRWKMM